MFIWAIVEDCGVLAFATKKEAKKTYPGKKYRQIQTRFFYGWLAMDVHGTENDDKIFTPDGREIPVVYGFCSKGCLLGLRGLTPRNEFVNEWRAIMDRVIKATLELQEYKQTFK